MVETAFAVGFDFDHTLGIDNKIERVAFVQLVRTISASNRVVFDEERAVSVIDREISLYRGGGCTLDDAVRDALERVLGDNSPPTGAVEAFRELAVSLVPDFVQALPGASGLLRELDAASIPYAILTNGWNPLQQRKADSIGFRKPVLVSDVLGVRKPSVAAFEALRTCLGLAPERIWYAGDDPRVDVAGSLLAGMNAIWFDWENHSYPPDVPAPTVTIHTIGETLAAIRRAGG